MGWSISLAPMHMVTRHILMQQLDGELARAYSFDGSRSCRPVIFAVSPRLGFITALPWAAVLNRLLTWGAVVAYHIALAFLLSSHVKPLPMHGPLPIWPDAGHLTFAILQSCSKRQAVLVCLPGRSRVHPGLECVPRWRHQAGLILPFCTIFILLDHMTDLWTSFVLR